MGSLGCETYIVLPIQGNQKEAPELRFDGARYRLFALFAMIAQINAAGTADLLLGWDNRQGVNNPGDGFSIVAERQADGIEGKKFLAFDR